MITIQTITYRGYTLRVRDDDYRTQIWDPTDEECISTEANLEQAKKVVDYWVDGAQR